jgi:hypothetical protein
MMSATKYDVAFPSTKGLGQQTFCDKFAKTRQSANPIFV